VLNWKSSRPLHPVVQQTDQLYQTHCVQPSDFCFKLQEQVNMIEYKTIIWCPPQHAGGLTVFLPTGSALACLRTLYHHLWHHQCRTFLAKMQSKRGQMFFTERVVHRLQPCHYISFNHRLHLYWPHQQSLEKSKFVIKNFVICTSTCALDKLGSSWVPGCQDHRQIQI
jgi:hypothetical protein